ncbi:prolactin receptor [Tiliqua scincoides]|uniref:prolactin receptor n=1 Tax=Tiliqua scincoides TaxID=71010 RepID=UPI003462F9DD
MRLDSSPSMVLVLLLFLTTWLVNGQSPPGKPKIINCWSSGNKTFTCWWKPGSDGGIPTNYTLLYKTEGREQANKCPDYISGGPNSCYFDKKLTSLWTAYNITVEATNSMGSSISDFHYVDTTSLAKLDPPVDLSLELRPLNGLIYVWAKWPPPPLMDHTASLVNYELRLKPVGEKEWEVHFVGKQMQLKISQLNAGMKYVAQVRSVTDHGEKSEWSPESYIQLPIGQPPGKPELIRCRSPEKETFTCWWKPGSDGGLPTNYSLFYNKEGKEPHECPDYITSGPNSCYFDKKHTSLWTTYNITIKATNAMGTNVSQSYFVDVTNEVQPNPPENLTLKFNGKHLLFKWSPPSQADVKSGWLTLEYELRIKPEEGQEWENIFVGQRTSYRVFSLNPGEKYITQVRCRTDHGEWSDWSSESYFQIPKEVKLKDMLVWIFVGFLSFVICLIMVWTMALKRINMMACILPPVPGPKIKGLDAHLLQAGKIEEFIIALGGQGFPPTSDDDDLAVECLEIDDSEDQQLMPANDKNHPNKSTKLSHKETDNDSGRGSCESPSLMSEKRKEARSSPLELKIPEDTNVPQGNADRKNQWETPNIDLEGQLLCLSGGGAKSFTWPGAQQTQTPNCSYHETVDLCKPAVSAMNVNRSSILMESERKYHSDHPKICTPISEGKPAKLEEAGNLPFSAQYDQSALWLLPPERSQVLSTKPVDYVEVHKVNHDGALAVLPKQKENIDKRERYLAPGELKEYTKVSTVVANHILVLMPDPKVKALPSFQELPKEPTRICQQSQAEKNMSYCLTGPSPCKAQTGGLDYMDPNNFMCSFN